MIKVTFKILTGGRQAASKELYAAKIEAIKRNGRRSFVSSKKAQVWHHGFDVSTYPMFAASPWNLWAMTEREHRIFHSWMGGTHVSCTPADLYRWKYFFYQWWKGWGLIALILLLIIFMNI